MDAATIYAEEFSQHTLLTAVDEKDLVNRAQAGDAEALHLMVKHNQRLVMKIANMVFRSGMTGDAELLDLIQYGNMGLLRAINKFDTSRGFRFSTYATRWIMQFIYRYGRVSGLQMTIPVHEGEKLSQALRLIRQAEENGESIPLEDVTQIIQKRHPTHTQARIQLLLNASQPMQNLDYEFEDSGESYGDIYVPAPDCTEDQAVNNVLIENALSFLKTLPKNYYEVFIMRHVYSMTFHEIARVLKMTRQNVQQIDTRVNKRVVEHFTQKGQKHDGRSKRIN